MLYSLIAFIVDIVGLTICRQLDVSCESIVYSITNRLTTYWTGVAHMIRAFSWFFIMTYLFNTNHISNANHVSFVYNTSLHTINPLAIDVARDGTKNTYFVKITLRRNVSIIRFYDLEIEIVIAFTVLPKKLYDGIIAHLLTWIFISCRTNKHFTKSFNVQLCVDLRLINMSAI